MSVKPPTNVVAESTPAVALSAPTVEGPLMPEDPHEGKPLGGPRHLHPQEDPRDCQFGRSAWWSRDH
jgi:hypothetical protein